MWFRALRRKITGGELNIRAYKRFDALTTTGTDRIVYHGDSRPFAELQKAGGMRRYISSPHMPKPTIMDSGGTKNSVTTTAEPDVAASYATRGGAVHTFKGKYRYVYALFIPAGQGIDLTQLPAGTGAGQLSDENRRTAEVLTLDVPIAAILGYRVLNPSQHEGLATSPDGQGTYVRLNDLPAHHSVPAQDVLRFDNFKVADGFNIIPV